MANSAKRTASTAPSRSPLVRPSNVALGIERIGLVALHIPIVIMLFVGALGIAAILGVMRIKVDNSLSQLFRSETPEFKKFEEVSRRFPSNEFDVLIVIEGDTLLQRATLEKLRNLAIDLQLIADTRGVISIFSAREPPMQGRIPPPLFPDPLPQGDAYRAFIDQVMDNEIIRGKLLSADGKLTLLILRSIPRPS